MSCIQRFIFLSCVLLFNGITLNGMDEQQSAPSTTTTSPLTPTAVQPNSVSSSFFEWLTIETSARTNGYATTYMPFFEAESLRPMGQKHFKLSTTHNTKELDAELATLGLEKKLSEIADRIVREHIAEAVNGSPQQGMARLKITIDLVKKNKVMLGTRTKELLKTAMFYLQRQQYNGSSCISSLAAYLSTPLTNKKQDDPFAIMLEEKDLECSKKHAHITFTNKSNAQSPETFMLQVPIAFKTSIPSQSYFSFNMMKKLYRKGAEKLYGYEKQYKEAVDTGTLEKALNIAEYTKQDLGNINMVIDYLGELITVEHVASNVLAELAHSVAKSCFSASTEPVDPMLELTHVNNLQLCLKSCKIHNYPINPVVNKMLTLVISKIQTTKQTQASQFTELNSYLAKALNETEEQKAEQ